MAMKWYIIQSQPYKEELLWHQIQCHDIHGFFPRIRVQRVNPRAREVRPYFPGYLFIQINLETTGFSTLKYIPYSKGIITFDNEPAEIPETLIVSIRNNLIKINQDKNILINPVFKPGDPVIIQSGPLSAYEAVFDERLTGKERSRILIKTLSAQNIRVEVPNKLIRLKTIRE